MHSITITAPYTTLRRNALITSFCLLFSWLQHVMTRIIMAHDTHAASQRTPKKKKKGLMETTPLIRYLVIERQVRRKASWRGPFRSECPYGQKATSQFDARTTLTLHPRIYSHSRTFLGCGVPSGRLLGIRLGLTGINLISAFTTMSYHLNRISYVIDLSSQSLRVLTSDTL